jgi:hypothetical protein
MRRNVEPTNSKRFGVVITRTGTLPDWSNGLIDTTSNRVSGSTGGRLELVACPGLAAPAAASTVMITRATVITNALSDRMLHPLGSWDIPEIGQSGRSATSGSTPVARRAGT